MAGWNLTNARLLRESLRGVSGRADVARIIREWWQAPEQASARQRGVSVADTAAHTLEFAASFPEHRQHVIERASVSRGAWDGLRAWAHSEAVQGRAIAPDVALVLLTDRPKGRRPKGQTPAQFARERQLAAIVGGLKGETPFDSLETSGRGLKNAFSLASDATREPFNKVRHAWTAHKDIFGANN